MDVDNLQPGQAVGYLVVGHGTRSRSGQDQVRALFAQMTAHAGPQSLCGLPAELAFLELAEPSIPVAVARLFQSGVRELVVIPVLLFSAGHAQFDIPSAVEAAAGPLGLRVVRQCSSLCLDPLIVALSAERFRQALASYADCADEPQQLALARNARVRDTSRPPGGSPASPQSAPPRTTGVSPAPSPPAPARTTGVSPAPSPLAPPRTTGVSPAPSPPAPPRTTGVSPAPSPPAPPRTTGVSPAPSPPAPPQPAPQQIALALIGRGSSSEAATSAMLQFAELRTQVTPVGWSSVGFIHAQRPSLDEALDALAATGLPWLVVQPHLLFEGELVEDLRREVAYRQSFSASQTWIITETLGSGVLKSDNRLAAALCKRALETSELARTSDDLCPRCHQVGQWCRAARPAVTLAH